VGVVFVGKKPGDPVVAIEIFYYNHFFFKKKKEGSCDDAFWFI
jgi:hypothetical protein